MSPKQQAIHARLLGYLGDKEAADEFERLASGRHTPESVAQWASSHGLTLVSVADALMVQRCNDARSGWESASMLVGELTAERDQMAKDAGRLEWIENNIHEIEWSAFDEGVITISVYAPVDLTDIPSDSVIELIDAAIAAKGE